MGRNGASGAGRALGKARRYRAWWAWVPKGRALGRVLAWAKALGAQEALVIAPGWQVKVMDLQAEELGAGPGRV